MIVLHNPSGLLHSTVELLGAQLIPALECPERITAIVGALSASSHHTIRTINFDLSQIDKQAEPSDHNGPSSPSSPSPSLISFIAATHIPAYLKHLSTIFQTWSAAGLVQLDSCILPECFTLPRPDHSLPPPSEPKDIYARVGYYAFDMSSGINAHSYQAILGSANLALEGPSPGHPATTAMARAAGATATSITPPWLVLYVSIHGRDEFPYYTGSAAETGAGAGAGFNVNLPLDTGSSYAEYAQLLDAAIARIREHAPRFLVVSLGFDTFELDPLGKFGIEMGDYERMARAVRKGVMKKKKGGRMTEAGDEGEGPVEMALILLEGGYVVDRLGENMLSFLKGWEEEDD
ncbi:hypothetical protein DV736_g3770, partial [Chaetothyriales sp. CBS 134916]